MLLSFKEFVSQTVPAATTNQNLINSQIQDILGKNPAMKQGWEKLQSSQYYPDFMKDVTRPGVGPSQVYKYMTDYVRKAGPLAITPQQPQTQNQPQQPQSTMK